MKKVVEDIIPESYTFIDVDYPYAVFATPGDNDDIQYIIKNYDTNDLPSTHNETSEVFVSIDAASYRIAFTKEDDICTIVDARDMTVLAEIQAVNRVKVNGNNIVKLMTDRKLIFENLLGVETVIADNVMGFATLSVSAEQTNVAYRNATELCLVSCFGERCKTIFKKQLNDVSALNVTNEYTGFLADDYPTVIDNETSEIVWQLKSDDVAYYSVSFESIFTAGSGGVINVWNIGSEPENPVLTITNHLFTDEDIIIVASQEYLFTFNGRFFRIYEIDHEAMSLYDGEEINEDEDYEEPAEYDEEPEEDNEYLGLRYGIRGNFMLPWPIFPPTPDLEVIQSNQPIPDVFDPVMADTVSYKEFLNDDENNVIFWDGEKMAFGYGKEQILRYASKKMYYECENQNEGLSVPKSLIVDRPYVVLSGAIQFYVPAEQVEAVLESTDRIFILKRIRNLKFTASIDTIRVKQDRDYRGKEINVVSSDHCQAGSEKPLYHIGVYKN